MCFRSCCRASAAARTGRGKHIMAKFKNKIAVKSIFSIIFILALFAAVVAFIGYHHFTKGMYDQYTDVAFRIADAGARTIDADSLDSYLAENGSSEDYQNTLRRLDQICNAFGATFIYVIQPDQSDYGHITFLFSTVNRETDYSPYEIGYVRETTNDEYRMKYQRLYDRESDRELLLLNSRRYSRPQHHITAMVPLLGSDQQTKGILCVQRQMDAMTHVRVDYVRSVLLVLLIMAVLSGVNQASSLKRVLLRPLQKITDEATRFARENTLPEHRLTETVRNTDEIGFLAASVDSMEEQNIRYVENITRITGEKERIEAELDIAKRIQVSMLPSVFPPFPDRKDFEIFAAMDPAREIGGDFYDFFLLDDDHLALVIADVSGKGIPAALFMSIAKKLIKISIQAGDSPAAALFQVNNQLCDENVEDMFVTVWLAVVELSTGKGVAANAGHEHPAIRRKGGSYELSLYHHSLVVAAMKNVSFREHKFQLYPGDSLFVYTDGVPEATNARDELFGTDRMLEAMNRNPDAGPEELLSEVGQSMDLFVGDSPQFDDITMLCFHYIGPGEKD